MFYNLLFSANFLNRYLYYKKMKKLNIDKILKYRQGKLNKIVSYAVKNSEFYNQLYRERLHGTNISIEDLPVINKKILRENFDQIVTSKDINTKKLDKYFKQPFDFSNKFLNKYLAFHTSGSTGNTAYVVWGPREFAIATAMLLTRNTKLLTGDNVTELLLRRKRYVYFGIMDDYVGGNSWVYAMRYLTKLKMLSIFSPIEELCEELNKFKPEFIMGKPHLLGELALQKKLGKLDVTPEKIIFVGEMLMPHDSERIEKYFDSKPINSYSTCETGPVAVQADGIDGLDIIEEEILVELLDDEDKPIKEYYKTGRIVITNLYNKVMPIIRYDIGDSACYIPGKHEGHFNRISYIKGRKTSYFIFETKVGKQIKISEFPFWSLYVPGIARYQVIQDSVKEIHIKIEWERGFTNIDKTIEDFRKKVMRIFEKHNDLNDIKISFEYVDKIVPNKSGKIKITFPL